MIPLYAEMAAGGAMSDAVEHTWVHLVNGATVQVGMDRDEYRLRLTEFTEMVNLTISVNVERGNRLLTISHSMAAAGDFVQPTALLAFAGPDRIDPTEIGTLLAPVAERAHLRSTRRAQARMAQAALSPVFAESDPV